MPLQNENQYGGRTRHHNLYCMSYCQPAQVEKKTQKRTQLSLFLDFWKTKLSLFILLSKLCICCIIYRVDKTDKIWMKTEKIQSRLEGRMAVSEQPIQN